MKSTRDQVVNVHERVGLLDYESKYRYSLRMAVALQYFLDVRKA